MEDRDQKVITFHSQYKAFLFRRRYGCGCVLRPVPRALSSSCGTAAFVYGDVDVNLLDGAEAVYEEEGSGWRMIWKEQN